MDGYFWRITDTASGRTAIALIGVNRGPRGPWATLGLATHPQRFLAVEQHGPRRAHGEQHGLSLHHVAFHQQHEVAVVGQYLANQTNALLRAQRERLRLEGGDQIRAGHLRQAGIVFDAVGARKPACAVLRANKQGGHAPHTRGDGAA